MLRYHMTLHEILRTDDTGPDACGDTICFYLVSAQFCPDSVPVFRVYKSQILAGATDENTELWKETSGRRQPREEIAAWTDRRESTQEWLNHAFFYVVLLKGDSAASDAVSLGFEERVRRTVPTRIAEFTSRVRDYPQNSVRWRRSLHAEVRARLRSAAKHAANGEGGGVKLIGVGHLVVRQADLTRAAGNLGKPIANMLTVSQKGASNCGNYLVWLSISAGEDVAGRVMEESDTNRMTD